MPLEMMAFTFEKDFKKKNIQFVFHSESFSVVIDFSQYSLESEETLCHSQEFTKEVDPSSLTDQRAVTNDSVGPPQSEQVRDPGQRLLIG